MSFQNKDFWMGNCPGTSNDGEINYDSSYRIEPKRSHQWLVDATEAELFPYKKQAVEVPNYNSFCSLLNSNVSPWGNTSSFQSISGHFTERILDLETARAINIEDNNTESVGIGNVNMRRKIIEDSFGSDSSFGLSISHTLKDPRSGFNYDGIRKVKVSQVKETDNIIPESIRQTCTREDNATVSIPHVYSKADDNCIPMGLSFRRADDNMVSMGDTFNRQDNFISMGRSYNKVDNSEVTTDHTYKEDNSVTSVSHSVIKDDRNITTMDQNFVGGDNVSMVHTFREDNAVSICQAYSKDGNISPKCQIFNKGFDNTISTGHSYNKIDDNASQTYRKIDKSNLSIGHSFSKGESNIISFGGFHDDANDINSLGKFIGSYDLLMDQSVFQRSEALTENELAESNADAFTFAAQIAAVGNTISKKKDDLKASKKAPPNNFPSNVRSLLSTGMLDGVPVKYIAWSREKELHGIIKGSGYLCACQSCNFSKVINAYEFERHACCKTKHPNNHIYFENGKTIYGIVQELRNTPQHLLFEVIQTITGSPINQNSFRLWRESFLAATRELQRIYGNEERKHFS